MRITILTKAGAGSLSGGFKVLTDYAQALQCAGHQVTMVSPRRSQPMFSTRGLRRLPIRKTSATRSDFLHGRSFDLRVLNSARAVSADDVPDADIIIASWWEAVLWMADLPASKGIKVHFAQDYERFDYLPQVGAKTVLDLQIPKIAVSSYVADQLKTHHGVTDVQVVANGVDTDTFKPRSDSDIRPRTPGLLYAQAPRKRLGLAFDALALAGVKAVGFGKAPLQAGADVVSRFELAPGQAQIPEIYSSCRLWIFPSEAEGFGLPILEAMACGTPVLATRAGAAPDLIDGQNGVLVDANAREMATEITRFMEMPEGEWAAASHAARATALSHTLSLAAQRFEAALIDIANRYEGATWRSGYSYTESVRAA